MPQEPLGAVRSQATTARGPRAARISRSSHGRLGPVRLPRVWHHFPFAAGKENLCEFVRLLSEWHVRAFLRTHCCVCSILRRERNANQKSLADLLTANPSIPENHQRRFGQVLVLRFSWPASLICSSCSERARNVPVEMARITFAFSGRPRQQNLCSKQMQSMQSTACLELEESGHVLCGKSR